MKPFYTLCERAEREYVINKSRFITVAVPVETPEQANAVIQAEKLRFPDATHHCFAYVLTPEGSSARYSDDGEPAGTAGQPILEVLRRRQLTNAVCVVTRYFGGILLGAGGLTRTYGKCAAMALDTAGRGLAEPTILLKAGVPYQYADRIKHQLDFCGVARCENTHYGSDVTFLIAVRAGDEEQLLSVLRNASLGTVYTERDKTEYRVWRSEPTLL